jgi:hypothetical protein
MLASSTARMACAIASRSGCRASPSDVPGGREERRWGWTGGSARCTAGTGAAAARGGGGTDGGRGVTSRARATGGGAAGAGGTAGAAAAGAGVTAGCAAPLRVRGGGARRRGAAGRAPGAGRFAERSSSSAPPCEAPFVGSATDTSISGSDGSGRVGSEGVLASVLISWGRTRRRTTTQRAGVSVPTADARCYRQRPSGGQRILIPQRTRTVSGEVDNDRFRKKGNDISSSRILRSTVGRSRRCASSSHRNWPLTQERPRDLGSEATVANPPARVPPAALEHGLRFSAAPVPTVL